MCQHQGRKVGGFERFALASRKAGSDNVHDTVLQLFHGKLVGHAVSSRQITKVKGRFCARRQFVPVNPVDDDGEGFRVVLGEVEFVLVAFVKGVLLEAFFHKRRSLADEFTVEEEAFALVADVDGDDLRGGEAVGIC